MYQTNRTTLERTNNIYSHKYQTICKNNNITNLCKKKILVKLDQTAGNKTTN